MQDDNKRCLAYKVLDAFEERILPDIDTFEQGNNNIGLQLK